MKREFSFTRFLMATAAIVIIFAGIKLASEIVVPFLLSLFIAIICSPVIRFMTERRIPRWLAISVLFLLIVIVFFLLVGLINNTIHEFTQSIPQYRILLSERLKDLSVIAERFHLSLDVYREQVIEQFDPSVMMNLVSKLLLSFSGVVTNVFVLFLVVILMLLEAPSAKHKFSVAFSRQDQIVQQENYIDRILQGVINYLGVKTIISLITGVVLFILLKVANVQYAILWATLTFLLNYIPNIGSIIAAVPIILQTLLLNGFATCFGVSVGIIVINIVIGNILEPKMTGRSLGLSTLVVFLSLLFWGWLLGTVGMLLSVPLTMVLKIALEASPSTLKYAALLGDVEES
ncbi:AI-2E family transporter [Seminibacterium arietis]|uniref:AI-2E family transporter n=1 Tax=Seminibacterium arietis TaxID=1173502 RepID=A0ABW3I6W3_9PAST